MKKFIKRPERDIPVYKKVDVLVAGGGPAGFAAAVTAARNGAKTLLVERWGFLGGMWTASLVNPLFDVKNKGGLNEEVRSNLQKKNAWGGLNDICFEPSQMILELDKIANHENLEILFYSLATEPILEGNEVKGCVLETKSGAMAVLADIVIDCTGDGDIAARAGADFHLGRPSDGLTQPMTMLFRIGGVNVDYPKDNIIMWYKELCERVPETELIKHVPYDYPAIIRLPGRDEAIIQWAHMRNYSALSAKDLTDATLEGRRQVVKAMEFLGKIEDVVGKVYLLELPPCVGIRETRRILGEYYLTDEDAEGEAKFKDGICNVNFCIDIHEPDRPTQTVKVHKGFQIPYRSLIPQKQENLLVAGRCISGSYRAHSAYRVTGDCVSMGEAAGMASCMALEAGIAPRNVNGEALVSKLKSNGINI